MSNTTKRGRGRPRKGEVVPPRYQPGRKPGRPKKYLTAEALEAAKKRYQAEYFKRRTHPKRVQLRKRLAKEIAATKNPIS